MKPQSLSGGGREALIESQSEFLAEKLAELAAGQSSGLEYERYKEAVLRNLERLGSEGMQLNKLDSLFRGGDLDLPEDSLDRLPGVVTLQRNQHCAVFFSGMNVRDFAELGTTCFAPRLLHQLVWCDGAPISNPQAVAYGNSPTVDALDVSLQRTMGVQAKDGTHMQRRKGGGFGG